MTQKNTPPDAELLIASGCSHCPVVLAALSEMIKEGQIGSLQVINIQHHPEAARARNTRSVPWTRIGPFELSGSYPASELRQWAERAGSGEGIAEYFSELLENQQLDDALALVRKQPDYIENLVALAADLDTPMGVRIGIGAMFEDLAASGDLHKQIDTLTTLVESQHSQTRADGAYYLGLIGSEDALAIIKPLLDDENAEVREIVREALESA